MSGDRLPAGNTPEGNVASTPYRRTTDQLGYGGGIANRPDYTADRTRCGVGRVLQHELQRAPQSRTFSDAETQILKLLARREADEDFDELLASAERLLVRYKSR